MMNSVFMGSPDFAIPSLNALHDSSFKIQAVISTPDKRRSRGGVMTSTPVKGRAVELGYPVHTFESTSDPEMESLLKKLKPDLLVVVAFRILPPEILKIPERGSINLHASLLPRYRGAAPIHWAIINGEEETGCSVFFLNESVDTGNVIRQVRTRIGSDETTGDLYDRLKELGATLLIESIEQIVHGDVEGVPQQEIEATPAPKLYSKDAHIDFSHPSSDVHNRIRGLSPFPGAWARYKGEKMNLYRSRKGPDLDLARGELLFAEGRYLLAGCGEGTVELRELQLPGKSRISGNDFANGYDLDTRLE
ncbi:MAG: methionyl-tRNA formyltransferase [Balneolaceae bacterium]